MVFRFKLVSDEVNNFSREIEIDSDSSFLSLRNAILESVDYSKDELDSFFLCNEDWEKEEEITLEDMGSSSDQDIWIMDETPIGELVEEEGQRMIFVFDYMTERCFYMELKEILPSKHLSDPVCTVKKGKAPAQSVDMEEYDKKMDEMAASNVSTDLDADFFGDAQFDEEDLPEGIDEGF